MTTSLHSNLLSAFLAGKSCPAIAAAHNLSVEDVLAWFESDHTQSTLRRLESLQLQQTRIVSFSVLPAATGSLSRTSITAPNPALQTRAASNLVRLGLRFSAPASRSSGAPSLREGVGGGLHSLTASSTRTSRHSEAPAGRGRVGGRDDSGDDTNPTRDAHAARDASPNNDSAENHAAERTKTAGARPPLTPVSGATPEFRQTAPRSVITRSYVHAAIQSPSNVEPPSPLLSRRETRVSALQNVAGTAASHQTAVSRSALLLTRHTSDPPPSAHKLPVAPLHLAAG